MSEISANSSSNIIKVSEIGMAFGREYYTVLSREPSRLHLFYAKNSTLLHADEGDLDTPISIGSEAIQNAVNKNSFLGSRFIIGSIDCHPSQNGGILVNVLGQIQKRGQAGSSRHFMQTFFLAEQPSGYFILNDNMRFLERPIATSTTTTTPIAAAVSATATEATPAPVAENTAPVAAPVTEPVAAPVVEPVAAPVESASVPTKTVAAAPAAEIAAPAPTKVKKITTAASKQKASTSPAPASAAADTPASEAVHPVEEVPAGPSSWAQLAAVQQNKWATGVVSHNKGTSIPSEEKPKTVPSPASTHNRKKSTDQAAPRRPINNESGATPSKPTKLPFVPEASLYVTGVTSDLKSDAIRAEFAALGPLAHFDVKYNSNAAFVEYVDPSIAKLLLEEGGIVVNGTRLTVEKRRVVNRNSRGLSSDNSASKDKDAAAKKFTPTKSNRRERPANKIATPAPTTAA